MTEIRTKPFEGITCKGYGVEMTPWRCIENQLSPMCLPDFPCHNCETPVGVGLAAKTPSRKRRWDKKTMSRTVARDLGLV